MHKLDADLPAHRAPVQFRNGVAMLISKDKAAGDAKNFREAAKLINTSTERGKMVQTWLNEMGDKYAQMEQGPELKDDGGSN